MKLKLDIRTDSSGKRQLHFPFMSISDIHMGTKQCRAKRLCSILEYTSTERLQLVGDIIDGEHLVKKSTWNFGDYQRQAIGHFLKKADTGTKVIMNDGNHEEGSHDKTVRSRLNGMNLYGIDIETTSTYTNPITKQNVFIAHGDIHDQDIFKDAESQRGWYRAGDTLLDCLYLLDRGYQRLGSEFSVAAAGKKLVKGFILNKLGVQDSINTTLDESHHDAYIYGHTHMAGFERTPQGKLVMNDGCCTEHAQFLVHDHEGNWAILEWHKDRLSVLEEDQSWENILWKDLELEEFGQKPTEYNDEYTNRADRILRLIAKAWPAKDRQAAIENLRIARAQAENAPENLTLQFKLTQAREDQALRIDIPRPDVNAPPFIHCRNPIFNAHQIG